MARAVMDSVKILMVGGLVPWDPQAGGGQIVAYKLGEALCRAGHNVDYVAVAPEEYQREVDWGNFIYASEKPGLLPSIFPALQSVTSGPLDKYDIVHVHAGNETAGYCLAYALRRLTASQPRFAVSIHSPKVHAFPRSPGEVITAFSCRSADLVLSVSEFSKRDISRAYRIPPSRIAVTYAGVDSSFTEHSPTRPKEKDGPFSLLFCGRLNGPHEQKAVDVLLKSQPQVLSHHKVVLNIIGTGPRLTQYQALAGELGIGEQVRFLGFVEHQEMPRHYQQADLFVLPSRRESFGLVLAEAMACGLPVVSTTAGAIPEVVEHGVTGILVPPDDPEALAEAINRLLSQPSTRKAMGIKGRERVEKDFTWDRVAERVMKGYEDVLQML